MPEINQPTGIGTKEFQQYAEKANIPKSYRVWTYALWREAQRQERTQFVQAVKALRETIKEGDYVTNRDDSFKALEELTGGNKMTITIDYKNGAIVQENKTIDFIQEKIAEGKDFCIGTTLLLLAIRVEVLQGRLDHRAIKLVNKADGTSLRISSDGRLDKHPGGELDNLLDAMLGI